MNYIEKLSLLIGYIINLGLFLELLKYVERELAILISIFLFGLLLLIFNEKENSKQ